MKNVFLIPIDYIIICIEVIFNINLLIVVEMETFLWSSNILCPFSESNLNANDSSIFAIPVLKFVFIFVLVYRINVI